MSNINQDISVRELVNKLLVWFSIIIALGLIILGIRSCSIYYETAPYTTKINIFENQPGVFGDDKTVAIIQLNQGYRVIDYSINYEDKKMIINLSDEGVNNE